MIASDEKCYRWWKNTTRCFRSWLFWLSIVVVLSVAVRLEALWFPVRGAITQLELLLVEDDIKHHALRALLIADGHPDPLLERMVVAHAGGEIDGYRYVNSIAALEHSYSLGARLFEVDVLFTSDGTLVLAHDWRHFARIASSENGQPSAVSFTGRLIYGRYPTARWTDVEDFLSRHTDALVITDTKGDNSALLAILAQSKQRRKVIPQVYSPREIWIAQQMGFERLILTVYRRRHWDLTLMSIAERVGCGIVMPVEKATPELIARIRSLGVPVFVHTVNDESEVERLPGVGVYTDRVDSFLKYP